MDFFYLKIYSAAFYIKMTQIAQHLRKYMVSMVFRYYRLDQFSMRYMVPLTSFTRQLN